MTCTLLTGGLGYIGSHIACVLAENKQKFIVLDNFSNCKRDVVAKLEKITKSLAEKIKEGYNLEDDEKLNNIVSAHIYR